METALMVVFVVFLALIAGMVLWVGLSQRAGRGERDALVLKGVTDKIDEQNSRLRTELSDSLARTMSLVNEQLSSMNAQVSKQLNAVTGQLQASTGQLNQRMDNAARVVGEVSRGLGELSKSTDRLIEVGRDISSLQEILRAPKLRGGLGEFFLGDLLGQILPPANYELQHQFRGGARVDAVIRLGKGLVPVDSKFPLENFKRIIESRGDDEMRTNKRKFAGDVKKHIDDIAASYILPDEGTFDFALMYIPAENVYYETIVKDEALGDALSISGYAFSKRVIPVSPASFYAYLQTILLGLRGMEISRQVKDIVAHLGRLKGDFSRFTGELGVMGKHINNAKNKYDEVLVMAGRFDDRLSILDVGKEAQAGAVEADEGRKLI